MSAAAIINILTKRYEERATYPVPSDEILAGKAIAAGMPDGNQRTLLCDLIAKIEADRTTKRSAKQTPLVEFTEAMQPSIRWYAQGTVGPALSTLLDAALYCVRRGWYVFPCWPRSKTPATLHGFKDATNDEDQISRWWAANPNYNPAIALGPSNLVVFDFDTIEPFAYLKPTFTVKTGRAPEKGPGLQMYYAGSYKTHGHEDGGGEVRSRGAYVMAPGAIHPETGNQYRIIADLPLAESPEQNVEEIKTGTPAPSEELESIAEYTEAALEEVRAKLGSENFNFGDRKPHEGGFKWDVFCPNRDKHTSGTDLNTSTSVVMPPSGKLLFCCKHSHCGNMLWIDNPQISEGEFGHDGFRTWMEQQIGHRLQFGDRDDGSGVITYVRPPTAAAETNAVASDCSGVVLSDGIIDELDPRNIPPFDPSVIKGIYKKVVDLVTRGTTLQPQFAYQVAKLVVGSLMAGRVEFDNITKRPIRQLALIGEAGSGKGTATDRVLVEIMQPKGLCAPAGIKIVNEVDSGAGLLDLMFKDVPSGAKDWPVIYYCDEVRDLGHKGAESRNPGILDVLFKMADKYVVSRTLANRSGGSKTKDNAHLSVVYMGQNADVYATAFAGRTKTGGWERLYAEHGTVVEPGKLPPIDPIEAHKVRDEIMSLPYEGKMTFDQDADKMLEDFWKTQRPEIRKITRLKEHLQTDAYVQAFGQGRRVVNTVDVADAIKEFTRQLVIRRVFFGGNISDRVSLYQSKCAAITDKMEKRVARGDMLEDVAKSTRDYENDTHAYRENDSQYFSKAWSSHTRRLRKVWVVRSNKQVYQRWLPAEDAPCWDTPEAIAALANGSDRNVYYRDPREPEREARGGRT
jgi:hypothetical protein